MRTPGVVWGLHAPAMGQLWHKPDLVPVLLSGAVFSYKWSIFRKHPNCLEGGVAFLEMMELPRCINAVHGAAEQGWKKSNSLVPWAAWLYLLFLRPLSCKCFTSLLHTVEIIIIESIYLKKKIFRRGSWEGAASALLAACQVLKGQQFPSLCRPVARLPWISVLLSSAKGTSWWSARL